MAILRYDKSKLTQPVPKKTVPASQAPQASQPSQNGPNTSLYVVDGVQGVPVYDAGLAYEEDVFVLALGEAGVDVVRHNMHGKRVLRHFSCPAHHLVISHNGMRALALTALENGSEPGTETNNKEKIYRVHVLELDSGKSRLYGTLRLLHFSKTYNGTLWLTATSARVQIMDTSTQAPLRPGALAT